MGIHARMTAGNDDHVILHRGSRRRGYRHLQRPPALRAQAAFPVRKLTLTGFRGRLNRVQESARQHGARVKRETGQTPRGRFRRCPRNGR